MVQDLERGIFAVWAGQKIVGTAFMLADNLLVTCAHVVTAAGSGPGGDIWVRYGGGKSLKGSVVFTGGYSMDTPEKPDVAFLLVPDLPGESEKPLPLELGSSTGINYHRASCLGYLKGKEPPTITADMIAGVTHTGSNFPILQMQSDLLRHGCSGSPVLDVETGYVVGMICSGDDGVHTTHVQAVTSETIQKLWNRNQQKTADPDQASIKIALNQPTEAPAKKVTGIYLEPTTPYQEVLGRDAELAGVFEFVNNPVKDPKLHIFGPPGIGKSTLAAQAFRTAVREHPDRKHYWIDCRTLKSFDDILNGLGQKLGISNFSQEQFAQMFAEEPILLVLDGADHLLDEMRIPLSQLREDSQGRVIITSCQETDYWQALPGLGPLAADVAVLLLLQWRNLEVDQVGQMGLGVARSICEYLGYIPQTIRWASILQKGQRGMEGLKALANQLERELQMLPPLSQPEPSEPARLRQDEKTGLDLTLGWLLDNLSEDTRDLLCRLALLRNIDQPSSDITINNCRRMAGVKPVLEDFDKLLHELQNRYLIVRKDRVISLYSNVHFYVWRNFLDQGQPKSLNQKLLNRYKMAAARCLLSADQETGWSTGLHYLFDARHWKEVLEQSREKFGIIENERIFPPGDQSLLEVRAHWAIAYHDLRHSKRDEAALLVGSALDQLNKISKRSRSGENSQQVRSLQLRLYNIQALIYFLEDDNYRFEATKQEMERLLQESTSLQGKAVLGPLASEQAQFNLMIGYVYDDSSDEDLKQAEEATRNALQIFKNLDDDLYVLKARSNLASIYISLAQVCKQNNDEAGYQKFLIRSLEESKEIIKCAGQNRVGAACTDPYVIAAEYANILKTLYDLHALEEADAYYKQGREYCILHHQHSALISLLFNEIDIDAEVERLAEAWKKIDWIQRLRTAGEMASYPLPDFVAYAKIHALQAAAAVTAEEKAQNLNEVEKYRCKARKFASESDRQDQFILNELEQWLARWYARKSLYQ